MQYIEVERTLVRSPRELWEKLSDHPGITRWLSGAEIRAVEPPARIEWDLRGAVGVIELESAPWGTRVRARVTPPQVPAWERMTARHEIELGLRRLFADLGTGSLQGKESASRRKTPHQ
jgi:uncharacterized protein YndB with AHSA1/START domain